MYTVQIGEGSDLNLVWKGSKLEKIRLVGICILCYILYSLKAQSVCLDLRSVNIHTVYTTPGDIGSDFVSDIYEIFMIID